MSIVLSNTFDESGSSSCPVDKRALIEVGTHNQKSVGKFCIKYDKKDRIEPTADAIWTYIHGNENKEVVGHGVDKDNIFLIVDMIDTHNEINKNEKNYVPLSWRSFDLPEITR